MKKIREKGKKVILYSIAAIFSITFLLIIIKFFLSKDLPQLLWVCYISIFFIIIGLFRKNSNLVLSQVIILAIPDLLWIFDFACLLISGHALIGLVSYFPSQTFLEKVVSFQHLYTIPLSLFALSLMKVKKNYKVLLFSLAQFALIFFLTLLLVPSVRGDINCIHFSCVQLVNMNFLPYHLSWFLVTFGFTAISYFVITSIHCFVKNKKK
jgi:hypothetical protein